MPFNGSGQNEGNKMNIVEDVGRFNDGIGGGAEGLNYAKNIGRNVKTGSNVIGLAINVYQIGVAISQDGNQFGENARKAVDVAAGSAIGAEAGADAGAIIGAAVGV